MNPHTMGTVKQRLNKAKSTVECLQGNKHWLASSYRAVAVAAHLLLDKKIIAIPTDTIYGLAGLAQCNETIEKLYKIKNRDLKKPLSICLWNISDIDKYAEVNHLPNKLLKLILPGPTTIVLKRKNSLNPKLNEGIKNIGIRIPKFDFVRSLVKMVNQPIALTSANVSNDQSTVHPDEFQNLWSELDGVFYNRPNINTKLSRSGSTVVDLSVEGEFKILRKGDNYTNLENIFSCFLLKKREDNEEVNKVENNEEMEPKKLEETNEKEKSEESKLEDNEAIKTYASN